MNSSTIAFQLSAEMACNIIYQSWLDNLKPRVCFLGLPHLIFFTVEDPNSVLFGFFGRTFSQDT